MRITILIAIFGTLLLVLAGCDQSLLNTDQKLPPGYAKYTVKAGDTPTTLAKEFYGKYSRVYLILNANKELLEANNQVLKPGQVILLPPDVDGNPVNPKTSHYSR